MSNRLYLDANATTPPFPEVREAVLQVLGEEWGNPSSLHTEGRKARARLEAAREEVAALLGVAASQLIFTSGGTEAINTFLKGWVLSQTSLPVRIFRTRGEHPAVENTLEFLASRGWAEISFLPTDRYGRVMVEELREFLIRTSIPYQPTLLSVIAAHNETGTLQPVREIAEIAHSLGMVLFLDAVQWVGKVPLHLSHSGADGAAISAHKFGGPKGVGALWVRPGVITQGLLHGGPQERRRRGGTENLPGIVGMGVAARIVARELPQWSEEWKAAASLLEQEEAQSEGGFTLLRVPPPRLPQTFLFRIGDWPADVILARLDLEGVAVSFGSACSSGVARTSQVLLRLGFSTADAQRLLRISFPPRFNPKVIREFLQIVHRLEQEPVHEGALC